jgi:hypothetical protein
MGEPAKNVAVNEGEPNKTAEPKTGPAPNDLIKLAAQTFADYQRLTAEGKLGEAGQKLDELKRILDQMQSR